MYTVYTVHIHIQVCVSTSGIVLHRVGCPSANCLEIHHSEWEFCVWLACFSGT